ncbi:hypothetical protein [Planomonospora algeriensis]
MLSIGCIAVQKSGGKMTEKKKPSKASGKQKKAAIKATREAKQAKRQAKRPEGAE